MPYLLNFSDSKIVAMQGKFCQFATYARHLHDRAPTEFENFFREIKKRIYEVSKYRIPKNTVIVPVLHRDPHTKVEYFNEKTKIILVEKTKNN